MTDIEIIDLTPENIADYGVCGYKDVEKHLELRRKIDWFLSRAGMLSLFLNWLSATEVAL
jgi:hypothetical protein